MMQLNEEIAFDHYYLYEFVAVGMLEEIIRRRNYEAVTQESCYLRPQQMILRFR